MFRGKFTFGHDEAPQAHQQQYQQQFSQGANLAPSHSHNAWPVQYTPPAQPQAGAERYVETINYSKTSTNDTSISLQKAADRQANGGNSTSLNFVLGLGFAGLVAYIGQPLLIRSVEVFGCIVIAAFAVGFFAFYNGFKPKGGGHGSR